MRSGRTRRLAGVVLGQPAWSVGLAVALGAVIPLRRVAKVDPASAFRRAS